MPSQILYFLSIFMVLWLLNPSVYSQTEEDWRLYKPGTAQNQQRVVKTSHPEFGLKPVGEIDIIVDSRINNLNELKIEHPTKQDGYRVQIYFGNRNTAREKRAEFTNNYPFHNAYISYLAPNFRLRVGDFRTRLESEKFKNEIARHYPGSYIVKDKIELPPLEGETGDSDDFHSEDSDD